jgi:hypothetical protein
MMIPVSAARAVVHVLRRFGQDLQTGQDGTSLPESLRGGTSPELRVIISDGEAIYFSLAKPGEKAKLFGGIPLEPLVNGSSPQDATLQQRGTSARYGKHIFGGPEGSKFARMELSVTAVARALPLD